MSYCMVDVGFIEPNIKVGDILPFENELWQIVKINKITFGHHSSHPDGVKDNQWKWSFIMESLDVERN